MSIEHSARSHGGAVATHELHADGYGQSTIRDAVRAGRIVRVRQGWYLERARPPALVEAVRIGGRLTCSSALRLQGIWVVEDQRLHVAVTPQSCQLRNPRDRSKRLANPSPGLVVHWTDLGNSESRLMVDPIEALADLATCTTPEFVAASAESLLHAQPQFSTRIHEWASRASIPVAHALAEVDGRSESGTEFIFRSRMLRRRVYCRPQVRIAGVGRVDFVIGERLVSEVDGATYHTDPERFEADRRRDAVLSSMGYRVLRFSHRLVIDDWSVVEAAVLAAIVRGDHL